MGERGIEAGQVEEACSCRAPPLGQCRDQLGRRQNRVGEGRPVQLVRGVHHLFGKSGGGVLDQRDVIPELRGEPAGAFDTGVGQHADDDHPDDAALLETKVEIGVGESARAPVFLYHDVVRLRGEVGMPLATPAAAGEHLLSAGRDLVWSGVVPALVVARLPAAVGHDEHLDTRVPDGGQDSSEVVQQADLLGDLSYAGPELAAV